jgi:O-antigen ligase
MGEDDTSQARLLYWGRGIEMMNRYPITGIGYANWLQYSTDNYEPIFGKGGRPMVQVSHNIFTEAGSELGYTGLFIFIGLIGMTLYTNHRTRKLAKRRSDGLSFPVAMSHGLDAAMMGFLAGGFFVTVLYYPFFWINYAMTVALHHSVASDSKRMVSRPVRGSAPEPSPGGRTA